MFRAHHFCKMHVIRQESSKAPNHRTIFTLGWPPYCSDGCIKELFSQADEVELVQLQDKVGFDEDIITTDSGFKIAYIVFDSSETAESALKLGHKKTALLCKVGPTGLTKWCSDYVKRRTTLTSIEAQVTDFMTDFDKRKEENEQHKQGRLQKPDEDGWITVTRKNPKPVQAKR